MESAAFPYSSITYTLPDTFLSQEYMNRMPLPHRAHVHVRKMSSAFYCEICKRVCSGGVDERPVSCRECAKECCLSCRSENDYCTPCYKYMFECLLCRKEVKSCGSVDVTDIAHISSEYSRICVSCVEAVTLLK